ncbi:myosin a [Cystoisospora suis]|uniref:Myosin a n=1 Tax=Cystoisospora suis TaxID=483139 RepID=A0A2C6KTV8_9APIC|nr:myosin a [Cystoisospora suis]
MTQITRGNTPVWCSTTPAVQQNPSLLYEKCLVVGLEGTDSVKVKPESASRSEEGQIITVPLSRVWHANDHIDPLVLNDIGSVAHTNDPCVLDFLKQRYLGKKIYTNAGPLLTAINPFEDLDNTSDSWIKKYAEGDPGKLDPHVFTITRLALDNLHTAGKNQTIIVSGESGAGKTEATKQMMRYFAKAKASLSDRDDFLDARVEEAMLASNPVIEAFGNAKTLLNDNSSRFGRFMHIQVGEKGGIEYGAVQNFLLEKCRVLTQAAGERSYHIFYQLLRGASAETKERLHLLNVEEYAFLNSGCFDVPGVNDAEDFRIVLKSFKAMGMSDDEVVSVLSLVAGILLLGNVKISGREQRGIPNAAVIEGSNVDVFKKACALLFLDPESTGTQLTRKYTKVQGTVIESCWQEGEGRLLKESLAKAIYEKLFDWIIKRINATIEPPSGHFPYFIGMLDIFGFEMFPQNSLEQLFINLTNELLQKSFVRVVFELESKIYRDEGITSECLVYQKNDATIDLLCGKNSVFSLLEDQCLAPGGSDAKLARGIAAMLRDRERTGTCPVSGKSGDRSFTIRHSAGEVTYQTVDFLFKNKDVLRPELVEVVRQSDNRVTKTLFDGVELEKNKLMKGQLIASQFLTQLRKLMGIINETEQHFVRCVKPNNSKLPRQWEPSPILRQLYSLSVIEALQLHNIGFSYRRPFAECVQQFRFVYMPALALLATDPAGACQAMLEASNLPEDEWRLGKTMAFLSRYGQQQLLAEQRKKLVQHRGLVYTIEACAKLKQRREAIYGALAGFIRLQSHIRKKLTQLGNLECLAVSDGA